MAYDARGKFVDDDIIKDRATYLANNIVFRSTTVPGVDFSDDYIIDGDEKMLE